MKLFVDSADIEDIKEVQSWGLLAGVTTNPSLIAKEGRELRQVIREIVELADVPVSVEAVATESSEMIKEAREYASWAPNVVVKVPCTVEGLRAVHALSEEGIKTNVTLMFSSNQALMAARTGATYVSLFVGRLDDTGHDGMEVVRETSEILAVHDLDSEIIAASIRHPLHMTQAALAGAHIATAPLKVYRQMIEHPLTDMGLERFLADWRKAMAETSGGAAT